MLESVAGQWAGSTPLKKVKCTIAVYSTAGAAGVLRMLDPTNAGSVSRPEHPLFYPKYSSEHLRKGIRNISKGEGGLGR